MILVRGLAFLAFGLVVEASEVYDPLDVWSWRMPQPQGLNLVGVAAGDSIFGGITEDSQFIRSTNLFDWTSHEITAAREFRRFSSMFVNYGANRFLVSAQIQTPTNTWFDVLLTSTDGLNWTNRSPLYASGTGTLPFVLCGGPDRFIGKLGSGTI